MRKFPAVLACVVLLSFASVSSAQSSMSSGGSEKEKIEALYKTYVKAFQNKDVSAIMSFYDPQELFVFDVSPPREYPSWDAYKKEKTGRPSSPPCQGQWKSTCRNWPSRWSGLWPTPATCRADISPLKMAPKRNWPSA